MNDCECISSCYNTIIELLEDRNYIVPDELKNLTYDNFRYMYCNNKYNFSVNNSNNNMCHILFYVNSNESYKINNIRDNIKNIINNNNDEFIIILRSINNTLKKLEKEYNCNIFYYKHLIRNITKHSLVPKHEIISKDKEKELLKMYNLNNKSQLMHILVTDPICKYYNFKSGNIIKITRNTITSGENIVFRLVK